jgi:hypothetical protein
MQADNSNIVSLWMVAAYGACVAFVCALSGNITAAVWNHLEPSRQVDWSTLAVIFFSLWVTNEALKQLPDRKPA